MLKPLVQVFIMAGVAIAAQAATGVIFDSPRAFSVDAYNIATGDFNGDGKIDVAAVGSNDLTILLGRGNGGFDPGVRYTFSASESSYSSTMATADLNHDGKLDLVVFSDDEAGSMAVFLGNGDGTFQAPSYYLPGVIPVALTVADFNGDGRPDLAVAASPTNGIYNVSILFGKGDGTFQTPDVTNLPSEPYALAAADLNRDGKQDLVLTSFGEGWVLLGHGDGSFQAPATFTAPPVCQQIWSAAIADFNGDGIPDIAVPDCYSTVGVLFGKGDGTFQPVVNYTVGPDCSHVTAGDVNGDGRPDLVVGTNHGGIYVLLGKGNGAFEAPRTYLASDTFYFEGPVLADFNNDGHLDVALASLSGFLIMLGKGNGGYQHVSDYSAGYIPQNAAAGDFNGDGKPDLAVGDFANGGDAVAILIGTGDGTFQPAVTYPAPDGVNSVVTGDFNGDGKLDLAVSAAQVAILLGNGDGTFQPPVFYGMNGVGTLVAGDFNRDGKLDLALTQGGFVIVLLGRGDGSLQPFKAFPTSGYRAFALAAADFNGDGKLDLAVTNYDSGNISIMLGDGRGGFLDAVTYGVGFHPEWVTVADFNGDGFADLAVTARYSGTVSVLMGNGDGTFQPAVSHRVPGGAVVSVVAADFNGDGKQDLGALMSFGRVAILLGDGNGSFQDPLAAAEFAVSPGSFELTADFNLDGKPDLAVVDGVGIAVLTNVTPRLAR